jgi:hypothetical protein
MQSLNDHPTPYYHLRLVVSACLSAAQKCALTLNLKQLYDIGVFKHNE